MSYNMHSSCLRQHDTQQSMGYTACKLKVGHARPPRAVHLLHSLDDLPVHNAHKSICDQGTFLGFAMMKLENQVAGAVSAENTYSLAFDFRSRRAAS